MSVALNRGDVLRVKKEFEVQSARYTQTGEKLWSMRLTIGEGCELPIVYVDDEAIVCRAVEDYSDLASVYITLRYKTDDIIWDRVEIIKGSTS